MSTEAAALTRVYDVFGRRLRMTCDRAGMLDAIDVHWGHFQEREDTRADPAVAFHVTLSDADSRIREWQFFNNGSLLVIADDRRLVTGYFAGRPWQIHVVAYRQDVDYVYYYLIEPLLLMALARLGLVHWHSASVALGGAAVLIAGVSGSGKSTTALHLLRSGFAFVADDEVFLDRRTDGVRVLGVDTDLYATDETVAVFEELHDLRDTPLVRRGQGYKRRVPASTTFAVVDPLEPPAIRVVLFPTVRREAVTRLEPLSASAAMLRVLAQQPKEYPTLITDAAALQRRLDTYAALAETARCFDVTLGLHAGRLPAQIRELIR